MLEVKGFALLSSLVLKNVSAPKEESAILNYCILNRIPYKLCNRPVDRPEDFIPCGSVEWCEKFLPKEKTVPDYYPEFLKDHLYRKVWLTDKWPMEKGIFIKPSDRHKRFTGFVTLGGYRKKKKKPYTCSEVVSFTNEWRYYVADGKILTGEWYWGDEINTPDAPALNINIPENYCGALDFGTLTTGELALVEANAPYACGWYGKDHKLYMEWLIKGWKYIKNS
jgi:hypothetical protein